MKNKVITVAHQYGSRGREIGENWLRNFMCHFMIRKLLSV